MSAARASRSAWLSSVARRAIVGVAVRAGGAHQQVDVVEVVAGDQRLGVGDTLPQLQRALQQLGGVGLGVRGGRGVGRADRRAQRLGLVAGAVEVVGDRRREARAAVAGQPRLQRARHGAVQLGALAGQQVVVDDLAQQDVAEGVAVAGVDGDDVAGDRVAQRGAQRGVVEHLELFQERVVGGLGDRERADDFLGGLWQPLDADHQRVAEAWRQGTGAGGQQLLDEERVAVAAAHQAVDLLGRRLVAGDLVGHRLDVGGQQPAQLDAPRLGRALQDGQQRAQGMTPVQLVGAVAERDQHALVGEVAPEEGEEVAGRAVGPVDVLDDQDDGRVAAEAVDRRQQRLEEPRLGLAVGLVALLVAGGRSVGVVGGVVQARQQRRQLVARGGRQLQQRGVAGPDQRPQRADQRRVRQLAVAQLDALAAEHPRAVVARVARQLAEQPRLPDARLAGHERQRRAAGIGVAHGLHERRELVVAADQAAADGGGGHLASLRCEPDRAVAHVLLHWLAPLCRR